jgi:hypothetical protein
MNDYQLLKKGIFCLGHITLLGFIALIIFDEAPYDIFSNMLLLAVS